jgi:hypothetical protein
MPALPPWSGSDLPEPPPWTATSPVRVLGLGSLLGVASVGAGEWLLGPAAILRHGVGVLGIVTVSVLLQALLNLEMARYTLATGEPIFTGFMRTRPGPSFWGWAYAGLTFLQNAWPGWALAAGTAAAALFLGHLPQTDERAVVLYFGHLALLGAVLLILLAERVARTLDAVEWFMTSWILAFLVLTALFLVPAGAWGRVATAFVWPLAGEPSFPAAPDWALLAGLAAYSGAGGTLNATFTYWLRDKGFGMAAAVAGAPVPIGGERVELSQPGAIFPPTEDNLRRWAGWRRYLVADGAIWVAGSLLTMGLLALIAVAFVAPGASPDPYAIAAWPAGALASRYGAALWVVGLVAGLWILFSGQLANAEGVGRVTADLLWTARGRLRGWRPAEVRRVYYRTLLAVTLWGSATMWLADPLTLILIGAGVAAANLALLAIHTLAVARTLLPPGLRPGPARQAALLLCALHFGGLALLALLTGPAGVRLAFLHSAG